MLGSIAWWLSIIKILLFEIVVYASLCWQLRLCEVVPCCSEEWVCMHVWCVCVCMRACVRACVHACVRVCVCVCVCEWKGFFFVKNYLNSEEDCILQDLWRGWFMQVVFVLILITSFVVMSSCRPYLQSMHLSHSHVDSTRASLNP